IIKKDAYVHVLQYGPITKDLRSDELTDQKELKAAGAFAFTNDGVGVQTAGTMYLAMQEAAANKMAIVAHTEDESLLFGGVMHAGKRAEELGLPGILSATESSQIARDLILAEETGVHYHVCHVSTKESVRIIREAKKAGVHVTCEVCPHHLLLDDTIDCISTDHAPHGHDEKCQSFLKAPFGIVGSEYAFQLIYTKFVKTGIFTLEQVMNWMAIKPAEIFALQAGQLTVGSQADI